MTRGLHIKEANEVTSFNIAFPTFQGRGVLSEACGSFGDVFQLMRVRVFGSGNTLEAKVEVWANGTFVPWAVYVL